MPITQVRMATIVLSARSCFDAWRAQRERITELFHSVTDGNTDAMRALEELYSDTAHIAPSLDAAETIGREEQHLKMSRHRNVRNAARMRSYREGATQPKPHPTPRTAPNAPPNHYAPRSRTTAPRYSDIATPDLSYSDHHAATPENANAMIAELATSAHADAESPAAVEAPTAQQLADDAAFAQELFRTHAPSPLPSPSEPSDKRR